MAREYHNLRGVVRDITRALREGDYAEVRAFVDLLDDFADADAGMEDADDTSRDGGATQLELPELAVGQGLADAPQGHDSMRPEELDIVSRLGHAVERITRLEAAQGRVPSDAAHLATAFARRGSLMREQRKVGRA